MTVNCREFARLLSKFLSDTRLPLLSRCSASGVEATRRALTSGSGDAR